MYVRTMRIPKTKISHKECTDSMCCCRATTTVTAQRAHKRPKENGAVYNAQLDGTVAKRCDRNLQNDDAVT